MLYDEELTEQRKPENAYSTKIETAFDKAKAYDDMRDNIIGLRNSAWANAHNDLFSAKVITYVTGALLNNDHELLKLLQIPLVELPVVRVE